LFTTVAGRLDALPLLSAFRFFIPRFVCGRRCRSCRLGWFVQIHGLASGRRRNWIQNNRFLMIHSHFVLYLPMYNPALPKRQFPQHSCGTKYESLAGTWTCLLGTHLQTDTDQLQVAGVHRLLWPHATTQASPGPKDS